MNKRRYGNNSFEPPTATNHGGVFINNKTLKRAEWIGILTLSGLITRMRCKNLLLQKYLQLGWRAREYIE